MSKNTFKIHVGLLLLEKKDKKRYALIKDFNGFMCDHTSHRGKEHFCRYCLEAFRTKEMLKCHINTCFKKMINKRLKFLKKVNMLDPEIMK